ncbi:MAG TPA: PLP-dependent aminotransferase family protein [Xanthomonadales bacterium]|nr:PLP-dependent aminotransferase family protein [Xanthomonadales bacterium]
MSRKVTFDTAGDPDTINFGIGQPSEDLLPVGLLRTAAEGFFSRATPQELNYGERQGDAAFREALAGFLSTEHGAETRADSLFVTAGNSQALDFVCSMFTRPGDTVIVEEPSYFLAFRIFEDHGLNILPVPLDDHGMDIDQLETLLTRTKPALLYTIPSFQNPGGQSMNAERRQRLAQLSRQHDFIVAADEVYQMLWYAEPPPPALGTLVEQGNILSLGSFSKILAPGLRLGWIQTSPSLMDRLLDSGVVNSGGSFNHFTSLVVREALDRGMQKSFVGQLRAAYSRRVDVMDASLQEHFSGMARWRKPGGGYFFWLEFADGIDTTALRAAADRFQTGFQPGRNSSSRGALNNCLRLSFAHYGEDQIREGIARLARLFGEHGR